MKITVDWDLCESNAVCVGMAPDAFDLDDNDQLLILLDEVPENRVVELRQVAASCPKAAISIE